MKVKRLLKEIHKWGGVTIAIPCLVIIVTGILLLVRKEFHSIQPATQTGSPYQLTLSFDQILEQVQAIPHLQVESWEDIDRLDVRPNKGVVKVRLKSGWEAQLDTLNAQVLQVAYRRSHTIEKIHDASYFQSSANLWFTLPIAIILLILTVTGIYLFGQPYWRKYRTPRKD